MADVPPAQQPEVRQDASTGQVVPVAPTDDGTPSMAVKVYAPFKIYYEGRAHSVTGINATGPFDILPHHRNFLCMLVPGDLVVKAATGETKTIKIARALMHVKADSVTVFVDV